MTNPMHDELSRKILDLSGPIKCDPDELARLIRDGDMKTLEHITSCYGKRMLAVGRKHCRTETDAEDAVQDALVAAGSNLKQYRGDGPVEGWLVRMVANACRRMRRGRKNDPKLHNPEAVLSSPDASPEDLAMFAELSTAVGEALSALGPKDRGVVMLADAKGLSSVEIGERLGLSAGAVRVRLSRARSKIRKHLEERLDVPGSALVASM